MDVDESDREPFITKHASQLAESLGTGLQDFIGLLERLELKLDTTDEKLENCINAFSAFLERVPLVQDEVETLKGETKTLREELDALDDEVQALHKRLRSVEKPVD